MNWCHAEMPTGMPKAPTRIPLPRFIGQGMPEKGPSSPVQRSAGQGSTDSTFGAGKPIRKATRGLE